MPAWHFPVLNQERLKNKFLFSFWFFFSLFPPSLLVGFFFFSFPTETSYPRMMGTTASAAQQAVSPSPLESRVPGDGSMEDQHSLSIHSFQTLGLHNSKAKSIITNKVAPVVIT